MALFFPSFSLEGILWNHRRLVFIHSFSRNRAVGILLVPLTISIMTTVLLDGKGLGLSRRILLKVDESNTTGEKLEELILEAVNQNQKRADRLLCRGRGADLCADDLFLVYKEKGKEARLNLNTNFDREDEYAQMMLGDENFPMKKDHSGMFQIKVFYAVDFHSKNDDGPNFHPNDDGLRSDESNIPLAYPAASVRFAPPEGLVFHESAGVYLYYREPPNTANAKNICPQFFRVEVGDDCALVDGRCRWTGRELQWYPSALLKPSTNYRVSVGLEAFRKKGKHEGDLMQVRGVLDNGLGGRQVFPDLGTVEEAGKYFRFRFKTRAAEPLVLKLEDENGKRRALRYYTGESYEGLRAAVARRLGIGIGRVLELLVVPKVCKDEVECEVVDDKDVLDLEEGDLIRVEFGDEEEESEEEEEVMT